MPQLQQTGMSPEVPRLSRSSMKRLMMLRDCLSHSEGDKKTQNPTPPKLETWHTAHPGQTVAPPRPCLLKGWLRSFLEV